MNQVPQASLKSCLDGLWVVLVDDDGQTVANVDGRVPMMARAGNASTYLLGFKNVGNARKFLADSEIEEGAEPRMVVSANRDDLLSIARQNGVVGVLVDYDATTQGYSEASELY